MAVLYAPDTPYAKERVKWEAQYSEMGPGLKPYVKRDFPMMLHLAGPPAGGLGAPVIIETVIVDSEQEAVFPRSRGFRPTPQEAIDAQTAQQTEFATLAANRNWQEKTGKLSAKAVTEMRVAEDQVGGHLPDVPVTPIKKRGRKVAVKE